MKMVRRYTAVWLDVKANVLTSNESDERDEKRTVREIQQKEKKRKKRKRTRCDDGGDSLRAFGTGDQKRTAGLETRRRSYNGLADGQAANGWITKDEERLDG